jgi:hypothetical protein
MPTPMPTFWTNSAQNGASRHESETGPAQQCLDLSDLLGPERHDAVTRRNLPNPKATGCSPAAQSQCLTAERLDGESCRGHCLPLLIAVRSDCCVIVCGIF